MRGVRVPEGNQDVTAGTISTHRAGCMDRQRARLLCMRICVHVLVVWVMNCIIDNRVLFISADMKNTTAGRAVRHDRPRCPGDAMYAYEMLPLAV